MGPPVSLRLLLSSLPWARAHTHSLPSWGLFTWRGEVQDTVECAPSALLNLGGQGLQHGSCFIAALSERQQFRWTPVYWS